MSLNLLATFGETTAYIGYVLLAILILLVMITVHEFGHYITGKIFGFGIEEFSIGLGPKVYSRKKKDGEVFSVRIFPIGGFCAFKGEDDDSTDPTAFNNKKPWQRIIVLFSGAFMNYILSVLVIVLMFSVYGQSVLMTYKTVESPTISSEYCFNDKDIILKADGKNIYLATDLMNAVDGREQGDLIEFTVRRNGQNQKVMIMMRTDTHFTNLEDITKLYSALGIEYEIDQSGQLVKGGLYSTGVRFGVFGTLGRSFEYSFKLAGTIFKILGQLITGALGIGSLGGTVTTIAVAADAIKIGGFRYLLNITSLIGVNLAVFNLLPIPALDGSRIVFCGIEWIRRKPVNRRVEGLIHAVGLVLLLTFAIFIDLQRCF